MQMLSLIPVHPFLCLPSLYIQIRSSSGVVHLSPDDLRWLDFDCWRDLVPSVKWAYFEDDQNQENILRNVCLGNCDAAWKGKKGVGEIEVGGCAGTQ